jgi:hypothetical protein
MTAPTGQRDYSGVRLTRHAMERFRERFWTGAPGAVEAAEDALRGSLARTRRLGRNPENRAIAVLAAYQGRMLVAILQDTTCTTVLTWPQFEPRLPEFGRPRLPRKRGRMLRRLIEPSPAPGICDFGENLVGNGDNTP